MNSQWPIIPLVEDNEAQGFTGTYIRARGAPKITKIQG
jgi:hypothetical protein